MQSENVMSRLVQGDVGSGKTIIAFLALLLSALNGYQGALRWTADGSIGGSAL